MRQFAFGLTPDQGHVFHPAPREFAVEIRQLILGLAGYTQLPREVPFVGHFPLDRGQYVVLAKAAGESTYLGWVVTDKQYAATGYSPYRFVAADGALTIGVEVEAGGSLPATDSPQPTTDPMHHLPLAARIFEGFDEPRRKGPHRSIAVPDRAVGDAVFLLGNFDGTAAKQSGESAERPQLQQQGGDMLAAMQREVASLRSAFEAMARKPAHATDNGLERRLAASERTIAVLDHRLATLQKTELDQQKRWRDMLSDAQSTSQRQLSDVERRLTLVAGHRWRWSRRWIAGVAAMVILATAGAIAYAIGPGQDRLNTFESQLRGLNTLVADDDHSGVAAIRKRLADIESANKALAPDVQQAKEDIAELAKKALEDLELGVTKANNDLSASTKSADDTLAASVRKASDDLAASVTTASIGLAASTKSANDALAASAKKVDDLVESEQKASAGLVDSVGKLESTVAGVTATIGKGDLSSGTVYERLTAAESSATAVSGRVDDMAALVGDKKKAAAGTLLARLTALEMTTAAIRTWIEATCKTATPADAVAMSKPCHDFGAAMATKSDQTQ